MTLLASFFRSFSHRTGDEGDGSRICCTNMEQGLGSLDGCTISRSMAVTVYMGDIPT